VCHNFQASIKQASICSKKWRAARYTVMSATPAICAASHVQTTHSTSPKKEEREVLTSWEFSSHQVQAWFSGPGDGATRTETLKLSHGKTMIFQNVETQGLPACLVALAASPICHTLNSDVWKSIAFQEEL